MQVSFSPPSITDSEINAVIQVLKSGWITTGPKTREFEKLLSEYCGTTHTLCLNSATAGLELVLRLFDVGPGDEVITTPYTFAASSNVILHCGAKPVFADIKPDDFNIDPEQVFKLVSKKTKVILPVDFGGLLCDYNELKNIIELKKTKFRPKKNTLQQELNKILLLSDAAHSFGSTYNKTRTGTHADFTVFSFHAVKNLTTAEGGAITYGPLKFTDPDQILKKLKLLSLHGQSKDALDKMKSGGWQYTIETDGYKYNLTDIASAIGIEQLKRYDSEIIPPRKRIVEFYSSGIKGHVIYPLFQTESKQSNYHLYPLRLKKPENRNRLIELLAADGIAANVHFIPLPRHPLYAKLNYDIRRYPVADNCFQAEISLPVYPGLTTEQSNYVVERINVHLKQL